MINITIDGPSGAGKSTVAQDVAKRLGIIYLDTGAIYRAFAYAALKSNVNIDDVKQVAAFLDSADIDVRYDGCVQKVYMDGEDVTMYIRAHNISKAASDISKHIPVRIKLSKIQRKIAAANDVVLDGRDSGTYVLPNANFKFFLTADVEERASRRFLELKERGAEVEYSRVLEDIKSRDFNDSNRDFAPLLRAADAELIDSTRLKADEVADIIINAVRKKR
ncbi:MAG: (d)CMP kinase [Clostridiales bacterium]|jgi:cytidylate kinase|nr:(d)CMP kinase [Clostridiales bacterium]